MNNELISAWTVWRPSATKTVRLFGTISVFIFAAMITLFAHAQDLSSGGWRMWPDTNATWAITGK
jgi:hypothetical protein